jgi:hypothetical protein
LLNTELFDRTFQVMFIQRLTPVLCGIMLSGGLIASSVASQPTVPSKQNSQVQHLTCVQDTQGLMCNVDESLAKSKLAERTTTHNSVSSVPALITVEQLAQVSNFLLALVYFGLPSALVFAILRHDKRDKERTQLIERLERIWNQSPQA